MNMTRQQYEDYKYIMVDTAFLYLGGKFSYLELRASPDVPFKLKAIFERYVMRELDPGTTLESHFYYMKKEDFACETYRQLKGKVKCSEIGWTKGFFGKKKRQVYRTKVYKIDEFVLLSPQEKEKRGILIQEIVISKLSMMTFTV